MTTTKVQWAMLGGVVTALSLACGSEPASGTDETTGSGSTSNPAQSSTTGEDPGSSSSAPMTTAVTSTGDEATAAGTTASGQDTDPPVYFDLGIVPEVPVSKGPCGKVDFLFVIDDSLSMSDEQVNLINSFPGFISAIQGTLEQVEEYNIGVITTDAYVENTAVPGCAVLGGLVTRTGGFESSNAVCGPYAVGANFMTQDDDLSTTFACAAQVGTTGDIYERPMQAMQEAIDPTGPLAAPGGCNEGFVREDALLVIVIITDEYDGVGDPEGGASPGTAMDWYDAVIAAKGGNPENAVVVSLVHSAGGPCPPPSMYHDAFHIVTFTNLFGDNGLVGGICQPDYSPVLAEAVAVIDGACNDFVPQG